MTCIRGELVKLSRPNWEYILLQERLRELFKLAFGSLGLVLVELVFRALPEHELRAADVAFVSRERAVRVDNCRLRN
jgi:hypothetical protein